MPARNWYRASKRASWMMRLFGQTPEPSMAERGVAEFIASLRVIHASPTASLESSVAKTTLATFGLMSAELSERQKRPTSTSKMLQTTFAWDSGELEVTYETWATGLRRDCLQRLKRVLRTLGNDSSLWPTVTQDAVSDRTVRYQQGGMPLSLLASAWPTPTVEGGRGIDPHLIATKGTTEAGEKRTVSLASFARLWPTPVATNSKDAKRSPNAQGAASGSEAASMWMSPRVATGAYTRDRGRRGAERPSLEGQSQLWASPSSLDWKGRGTTLIRPDGKHRLDQLDRQAEHFRPDQTTPSNGNESSKKTRRLNPLFVEWLMGVPLGWTSCENLATESYLSWELTHSALLQTLLSRRIA